MLILSIFFSHNENQEFAVQCLLFQNCIVFYGERLRYGKICIGKNAR